jgi:hypothetical protein
MRLLVLASATLAVGFADPARPFNGKDLSGWKTRGDGGKSRWTVGLVTVAPDNPAAVRVTKLEDAVGGTPCLINASAHGVDLYTEVKYGDCRVELEFMVPRGSNSGVYLVGEYEVQIFDSFGKEKLGMGDLGAIYGAAAPKVNASKKPGEWQKLVIDFQAPRFDSAGKKTASAKFLTVTLNGTVLHENVEVPGPTAGGLTGREAATGPLMLQGDHGPVAYRNIRITPAAE